MKKRFPRFSLRALVIAVLAIAVCWTLTATWGVGNALDLVLETQREGKMRVIERARGHLKCIHVAEDGIEFNWTISADAIVPFLIRIRSHLTMPDNFEHISDRYHIWFFGFERGIF